MLFSNGLSIGMTDYYYPYLGGSFSADSANAYEVNLGFTKGGLNLSANYILNEASLAASKGKDMYFQAAYAFTNFNISVGAGDGWHTTDTNFNVLPCRYWHWKSYQDHRQLLYPGYRSGDLQP